jgi:hypothetical protein
MYACRLCIRSLWRLLSDVGPKYSKSSSIKKCDLAKGDVFEKASTPESNETTPEKDFVLPYDDTDTDRIVEEKPQDAVMIRAREGKINELIPPKSTRSGRLDKKPQRYWELGAFATSQDCLDLIFL